MATRVSPRHRVWMLLLLLAWLAPVARAEAPVAGPAAQPFLRWIESPAGGQLQTSIVRYVNDDGVVVDLIGAVHIGDALYYAQLNEAFKGYDAVLYEMVKPAGAEPVRDRGGEAMNWVGSLQKFMKDALDLSYQLDEVDYSPANFVHADLDAETFARMQAEQGESMLGLMLKQMFRGLSGDVPAAAADDSQMSVTDLLELMQDEDRSTRFKMILGRQFSNMDAQMAGMEGSVILDGRNKHALKVLREQIDAGGKKKFAIFYGAAHLSGMDELMTELMGFRREGEPTWLTAWDVRLDRPTTRPTEEAAPDTSTEPGEAPEADEDEDVVEPTQKVVRV